MPNRVPPPSPPGKIGFPGQPLLTVPASGLILSPGAGLIGRTSGGQLLLDGTRDSVAERVPMFTPGNPSARTIGKWRNRRASGASTLAVLEANWTTAPTTGDGTNFYKIVATDGKGTQVVLPISTPGVSFYDLDRGAGVAIIDPFAGQAYSNQGNGDTGVGICHRFIPTQGMTLGSHSCNVAIKPAAGAISVGAQVRGQLWKQTGDRTTWTLLATAYASTSGGSDVNVGNAAYERLTFYYPDQVQVSAGDNLFVTCDIFESYTQTTMAAYYTAIWQGVTTPGSVNGGVPASWDPTTGAEPFGRQVQSVPGDNQANTEAKIHALTWDALALYNQGDTTPPGYNVTGKAKESGRFTINGTASGVAPVYGDLTFSLAVAGAPVAATSGTDLNFAAVLLP